MRIPEPSNKEKGKNGETLAAEYLCAKGFKIIAREWRAGSLEIDLIAENENIILFVEVKMRFSDSYGDPWQAVNDAKRRKIIRAADIYIRKNEVEKPVRFDIISILMVNGEGNVLHLEDAFWPTL